MVVLSPTARTAMPLTPSDVAVIVTLPIPAPTTRPSSVTVATVVAEDAQLAEVVRFWVLPSLKVPIAVNCTFAGTTINDFAGLTTIAFRVRFDVETGVEAGAELVPMPRHPANANTRIPTKISRLSFILKSLCFSCTLVRRQCFRRAHPSRHPAFLYRVTAFRPRCMAGKIRSPTFAHTELWRNP